MADDTSTVFAMSDETFDVIDDEYDGIDPGDAMVRYIRRRSAEKIQHWYTEFEERTPPEKIGRYQRRHKQQFLDAIGGLPERTPLNPTIHKRFSGEGYRLETVRFESQPNHHVTGSLYLPAVTDYDPPYPVVLVCCGHSEEGKARDVYARVGALLARNGVAGFVFDPICQGERCQLFEDGKPRDGLPTGRHMLVAIGSIPLGWNVARFMIHDAMRAIDYLQTREEIDGDKIGATGISGGGTQSAYLGALDDRVVASAPGCWITSIEGLLKERIAEDPEQNIHSQLSFGLDHADFLMMRAPAPTLVLAATDDFFDIDGTWDSVRMAKRLYGRLGYPERLDITEVENDHGFHRLLREASVAWMVRWLRGEDRTVIEPRALGVLEKETIYSTPTGQVLELEGERSVYDLNEEYEDTLVEERERRWASEPDAALEDVREIAGVRPLEDLPEPTVDQIDVTQHDGYDVKRLVFDVEDGIPLPAVQFVPADPAGPPLICLHDEGKRAAAEEADVEALVADGHEVLAIDLRGIGETTPDYNRWRFGHDWQEMFAAYRLSLSYVGMRAEDVLASARWLRNQSGSEDVRLRATGDVGVPALHAAALEPDLFEDVLLSQTLGSWDSIVRTPGANVPLTSLIHGALPTYDLPDLAASVDDVVTIESVRVPEA